jgi:hypothetical protein
MQHQIRLIHLGGTFMKKLRQLDVTRRLVFGMLLILPATVGAQTRPPIVEKVAKTYGLDSWDKIEAIRYTWNVQLGKLNVSRSWEWEPKTTQVTFEGKDKEGKPVKVTYKRSELSSQPDMVKSEVDPGFINDNYTLLFPLKAYWDSPAVIDAGMYNLPVGSGMAELVAVKYPGEAAGYTPGDTWELYVGKDGRVEYFVYHRGGAKKPSLLFATWGGQKKAGPLLLSTDHRGYADGMPVRVFFTDVAVKVTGSDTWVDAK